MKTVPNDYVSLSEAPECPEGWENRTPMKKLDELAT